MLTYYKNRIFYPWMAKSISTDEVMRLRSAVVSLAVGDVLEIGYGTGLNLGLYSPAVRSLTGIDTPIPPSTFQAANGIRPVLLDMSAEKMDFADGSFDNVVSTFTLCSIPDLAAALREVYRVLKPGGRFFFLEHGRSWDKLMAAVQFLSNPIYWLTGCGCRVTRDYQPLVVRQGFILEKCERIRLKSLPIAGYLYSGRAVKPG